MGVCSGVQCVWYAVWCGGGCFGKSLTVVRTGSAEMIAVSSLLTFDVYGVYVNTKASAQQLLKVSRVFVIVYGIFSGVCIVSLWKFAYTE